MTAAPEACWEFTEEKPLLRSSRELRVKAIAAIPDLLKQLKNEADAVLKVVANAWAHQDCAMRKAAGQAIERVIHRN